MPDSPSLGDGLIRSHELFHALTDDVHAAYELLEQDRQSQLLRRSVARAIFAYIEAALECIRIEVRSSVRRGEHPEPLSERELKTLGSLSLFQSDAGKFLPLDQSLKRTFKLAICIWRLNHRFGAAGEGYRAFVAAKSSRNRLTHPKTFYDIEVTDRDMHFYSVAFVWFRAEFTALLRKRIESFLVGLEPEDQEALRQLTSSVQNAADA
ncbi:hypothetical protein [Sulfuritalea sp.]|uniref:hypothetical protein n=1 Tax=Sulfuritalea sp. TaxID=2480090 RepID=UPI00286E30F0|nr:hypothetical protein [Sulfuritalea sp.]